MFQSIISGIQSLVVSFGLGVFILLILFSLVRILFKNSKRRKLQNEQQGAYISSVRFNGQGPSNVDLENEIESLKSQLGQKRTGVRIRRRNF